jgi:hypothetical protein
MALAEITTGFAGEDKKSLDTRKPPFAKISTGLPTAQRKQREVLSHERHTKSITFKMAMPVSYRVRSEISKERGVWEDKGRHWSYSEETVRPEKCRNR